MSWYLQMMNPNETPTVGNLASGNSGGFENAGLLYDAAIGDLEIVTTAGSGATRDLAVTTWAAATGLRDAHCLADGVDLTSPNCVDDTAATPTAGTDDLTPVTGPADDHCVEKWNLSDDQGLRCVRMKSQFTRKFLTPDTSYLDFDLDYRPYQVSTGWAI